ncbi:MAG: hypothetical protein KJS90_02065 [Acidobacteria bacterium]|nr:hypothetical protein [Acidobacteriota bacterium]
MNAVASGLMAVSVLSSVLLLLVVRREERTFQSRTGVARFRRHLDALSLESRSNVRGSVRSLGRGR